MDSRSQFPLIVVAGPTASGKTALALALAEHFGAEIVNYDSMQVYRDFDAGTAKPSAEELARVPHHFISEMSPETEWTAGEYARQARARIGEIIARGRLVVLAGGTGFYVRALIEGLFAGPQRDAALRQRLRARAARYGPEYLHRLLRRLDPQAAERIAARDASRVIRAIEVCVLTRRKVTDLWNELPRQPFAGALPIKLVLDPERSALYARINDRAAAMFAGGIQQETARLLARYPADLAVFQSHGYKQACDILLRGAPVADALAEAQQEQRNYAKRQLTWWRRERDAYWLRGFGDDPAVQREAIEHVREALRALRAVDARDPQHQV